MVLSQIRIVDTERIINSSLITRMCVIKAMSVCFKMARLSCDRWLSMSLSHLGYKLIGYFSQNFLC